MSIFANTVITKPLFRLPEGVYKFSLETYTETEAVDTTTKKGLGFYNIVWAGKLQDQDGAWREAKVTAVYGRPYQDKTTKEEKILDTATKQWQHLGYQVGKLNVLVTEIEAAAKSQLVSVHVCHELGNDGRKYQKTSFIIPEVTETTTATTQEID